MSGGGKVDVNTKRGTENLYFCTKCNWWYIYSFFMKRDFLPLLFSYTFLSVNHQTRHKNDSTVSLKNPGTIQRWFLSSGSRPTRSTAPAACPPTPGRSWTWWSGARPSLPSWPPSTPPRPSPCSARRGLGTRWGAEAGVGTASNSLRLRWGFVLYIVPLESGLG